MTDEQLLLLLRALDLLASQMGPSESIKVKKIETDLFQEFRIDLNSAWVRNQRLIAERT